MYPTNLPGTPKVTIGTGSSGSSNQPGRSSKEYRTSDRYGHLFRNRRCVITGGAGFIGRALDARLRELGAFPLVIDRKNYLSELVAAAASGESACMSTSPYLATGVAHLDSLKPIFAGFAPEFVFHLAAETEVVKSHTQPYPTLFTNLVGTMSVLEACRLHSRHLRGLVLASSDKAYGELENMDSPKKPRTLRLDLSREELGDRASEGEVTCSGSSQYLEHQPLTGPGDLYSMSKRYGDNLAHDYGRLYGLPLRVLRCANTYGPGQTNATTLITCSVLRLLGGLRPMLHAGREHIHREWLYIDDAVEAYLLAALEVGHPYDGPYALHRSTTTDLPPGWDNRAITPDPASPGAYAYNVGGIAATALQVVEQLCTLVGKPTDYYGLTGEVAHCPQLGHQALNMDRFATRFAPWVPVPLDVGLARTVAWYKANLTRSTPRDGDVGNEDGSKGSGSGKTSESEGIRSPGWSLHVGKVPVVASLPTHLFTSSKPEVDKSCNQCEATRLEMKVDEEDKVRE